MKFLDPEKSIHHIIDLIRNAREKVIIVSPYNDLNGWDELKSTINEANNKLEVSYYVREGEGQNGIGDIQCTVYEVPMLHAKMFFSESKALISSGNLTNRPDINWVCELNREEYMDIVGFFEQYIKPFANKFEAKK